MSQSSEIWGCHCNSCGSLFRSSSSYGLCAKVGQVPYDPPTNQPTPQVRKRTVYQPPSPDLASPRTSDHYHLNLGSLKFEASRPGLGMGGHRIDGASDLAAACGGVRLKVSRSYKFDTRKRTPQNGLPKRCEHTGSQTRVGCMPLKQ